MRMSGYRMSHILENLSGQASMYARFVNFSLFSFALLISKLTRPVLLIILFANPLSDTTSTVNLLNQA